MDALDISSIEKKLDEIRNKVSSTMDQQTKSTDESSTSKRKNNKKGKATTPAADTQQNSNKTADFDYAKIDFKKFQGGSQRPQQSNEFKSKFHGKVRYATVCDRNFKSLINLMFHFQGKNNKANKQFNKLLSFGNVGKKK